MRDISIAALFVALTITAPVPLPAAENSLIGVFSEAPADSKFKGAQITFTGLNRSQVTVVWPDGHDEELTKIADSDHLLVLQYVTAIGSTDTIYVEKQNKRFLVVSVGAFAVLAPVNKLSVGIYRGYIK